MKYTLLHASPSGFSKVMARVCNEFQKPGNAEITLALTGGRYHLDQPVVLDTRNVPGEKHLRILGGERIKTVFSSTVSIPAQAFEAIPGKPYYVCRLKKDATGSYPNLRTLYVDGKIATMAKTAEYRTSAPFSKDGVCWEPRQKDWETAYNHRLYVPLAAVEEAGIPHCRGAELHIRVAWEFKIFHSESVDLDDTYTAEDGTQFVALQLSKEESKDGNGILRVSSRVFFICNVPSVLTTPGQYAYDRSSGSLYYYPKGEILRHSFNIGKQSFLFDFQNLASLTLRGLTFTGIEDEIYTTVGYYSAGQAGMWEKFPHIFPHAGAVKIENVRALDVDDCSFTELPCDGISMVGDLKSITVRNSRFTGIGASAIRVGRPKDYSPVDRIDGIRIENNFIDLTGCTYENSCAVVLTKVRNARLAHNTVLRSSYTAISLGWKWDVGTWQYGEQVNLENVEVAYNRIQSFVTHMRDGGAIYTLGGNVDVGYAPVINTVHDNYIVEDDLTCPEDGFFASIYHDGASSNWHTYSNVVIHNPKRKGVHPHYSARIYLQVPSSSGIPASTEGQAAWHILCENNYICGCKSFGEVYRSQAKDPQNAADMLDESRDLRQRHTHLLKSPKDLQSYADARRIVEFSGCDLSIKGNRSV